MMDLNLAGKVKRSSHNGGDCDWPYSAGMGFNGFHQRMNAFSKIILSREVQSLLGQTAGIHRRLGTSQPRLCPA